jgi:hypothetical protein
MFNFSPTIKHGEKVIAYEDGITGGVLKINDAYDLSLIQMPNGHYELRLFMKLQFFFKDDGINRWLKADKQKFITNWESRVRKIWDGHVLKLLSNSKPVRLKLDFQIQIDGIMFDHWEITVKKVPAGAVFRSFVRPGMKDVTLTENDNGVTVRKVRKVGGFQQITSAHEFGHMIGLDDEYGPLFGGAQGVHNSDFNSVMNIGSKVKKRHISELMAWLRKTLNKNNIK